MRIKTYGHQGRLQVMMLDAFPRSLTYHEPHVVYLTP